MATSGGRGVGLSVLTGLIAIVLGIILLADPNASLKTVIYLFGIMVIVYGVARAVSGLMGHMESRSAGIVGGILAIIAGVAIIAWPKMSALTLLYVIAGWAIASGVWDVVGAFASDASGGRKLWSAIVGVVSVVFGLILFVHPAEGALAMLWFIGVYLIVLGFMRIVVGVFGAAGRVAEQQGSQGPHPF